MLQYLSIIGVVEDVTEIIFDLKGVRFSSNTNFSEEPNETVVKPLAQFKRCFNVQLLLVTSSLKMERKFLIQTIILLS